MLNYEALKAWPFTPVEQSYSRRDSMLYALGLGFGHDPIDAGQLRYVYEPHLQVVPSMAAVLGAQAGWLRDPRPIRPLAERLSDVALGGSGRTWTAVALGRICDFDPWPWVARWSVGTNYDAQLSSLIDDDFQSGLLDLP